MNPAGGLARRAWLINQVRTNYPATPLVLLDTGNFSDNPTEVGDLRTATLLQSMKALGYKAINVGERDLTLGYDDFVKRTEGLGLKFISTNIVKQGTKEPIFQPYVVFEVKGASGKPVRVGVLGVDRYSPVWQKAGPAGTNLGMAAPADMIATYLPELRAKSDVVVLLAALSKEDAHDLASGSPTSTWSLAPTAASTTRSRKPRAASASTTRETRGSASARAGSTSMRNPGSRT